MPPTDRWSKWTKKQNHKPSNFVPHFTKPNQLEKPRQSCCDWRMMYKLQKITSLMLKITQGSKKITSPNRNLTWSWWPGHALHITLPIRIPTERPKPCCKIYALVWWTFHHHRCLPTCIHNCNAKCTQNIPQLPYILTQTICTKQCEPISVLNPKAAWHSSHGQGRRVVHQLHHKWKKLK